MKLEDWRNKEGLSQQQLADALIKYAKEKHPEHAKQLAQTTLGYWERGTLPRKGWLIIIQSFTKGNVTASDFVNTQAASAQAVSGA